MQFSDDAEETFANALTLLQVNSQKSIHWCPLYKTVIELHQSSHQWVGNYQKLDLPVLDVATWPSCSTWKSLRLCFEPENY